MNRLEAWGSHAGFLIRGLLLVLTLVAASSRAPADELFPPAPLDQVSIRTLPGFTALQVTQTTSLAKAWSRGFRLGGRYAARAGSHLNTPTLLVFPDWEKRDALSGDQVPSLMLILLDPLPNYPSTADQNASLQRISGGTVACYAEGGVYTAERFAAGLKKIEALLQTRGLPPIGPARYVYYSTIDWLPAFWHIGEVQVPIASGAPAN